MKVLVTRFSSLGDVAMTVPVIQSVATHYPQVRFVVLSRPFVTPLFEHLPSNVSFHGVDLNLYKGLRGMFRLYRELRHENFDAVADLHDVLRTKMLRRFFRLEGTKTAHVDKGRKEKAALTRKEHKVFRQLDSSFVRYARVFEQLGLSCPIRFSSIYGRGRGDAALFDSLQPLPATSSWIGLAPFAAHAGKMLPEHTLKKLVDLLTRSENNHVFLFGGGEAEKEKLEELAKDNGRTTVVAGRLKLPGELALMSHLQVLVSMDSANMHLASLTGTPVVSVWGATHPYAGFMGWNQTEANAVQADLPCRPCSIFGNKPCYRADYACLHALSAEQVADKVYPFLRT